MPANQFLPFATGSGADTLTPAQYAAAAYLQQGFQAGVAQPYDINTVLRQVTTAVSAVAQFIADNQTADVNDDGVVANFELKFEHALTAFISAAVASDQVNFAAAANGGLAKSGNNFLLGYDNLPVETTFNTGDKVAFYTEESENGLAAATPYAASLGTFSNYLSTNFQSKNTFTRISATNAAGMSLQNGDVSIPLSTNTVAPLLAANVSPALGSCANGVFTANASGYYIVVASGAIALASSGHANDFGLFRFNINVTPVGTSSSTGSIQSTSQPIIGGGQASGNIQVTTIQHLNTGDQVELIVYAASQYGDAVNVILSGYTNMLVALLNA